MKPSQRMVEHIQRYDNKLSVQWNNVDHYFEIYRKMPWGNRLITPVTKFIYTMEKKDMDVFCPLDMRIIAWLYSADPFNKDRKKSQSIKYLRDKRFSDVVKKKEIQAKKRKESYQRLMQDYYFICRDDLNKIMTDQDSDEESTWVRPDLQNGVRRRIMSRSKKNALRYFNDEHRSN